MCLIAFAYKQHPFYHLVFAANRDEFYGRPAVGAHFWDDYPTVLAGKDQKAGGTWMGINRTGQFAAVTNYRSPRSEKDQSYSRGKLVLHYLSSSNSPEQYLQLLKRKGQKYNGFNLLFGSVKSLFYHSNKSNQPQKLHRGIYGLSNKFLDTPWPKVEQAKRELSELIEQKDLNEEALFEMLKNERQAPDSELPDTGISKELERAVSPIFIKTDKYGTRCSTILLIDKNGKVTFEERSFKPGSTKVEGTSRYEFEIEGD